MDRRLRSLAIAFGALAAAGCQSASTPAPQPTPPPAASAAPTVDASPSPNPKADAVAKLAAQQAASIDALLAARAAGERGVTVVEPPPAAAPTTPAPPPVPTPAPTAADQLRPVPPLDRIPDAPTTPEPAAVAAETPAVVAPPVPTRVQPSAPPPPVSPTRAEDSLAQRLGRRAAEVPRDLAAQLDNQLYQFAADAAVPTADAMAGLSTEDKNVLGSVLDGLSNFRTAIRNDNNLLIGDKIRPLLDMADRLQAQADLRVANVQLCHTVTGYGKYDPITPLKLQCGGNPPLFYYEIENFNPRLDASNLYVTTLQQDMVLYDKNGKPVWSWLKTEFKDTCRERRHDFFFAGKLKLNMNLPAGNYTLKITLTDPAAQRVGEKSVSVALVDAPAAAVTPALPTLEH